MVILEEKLKEKDISSSLTLAVVTWNWGADPRPVGGSPRAGDWMNLGESYPIGGFDGKHERVLEGKQREFVMSWCCAGEGGLVGVPR